MTGPHPVRFSASACAALEYGLPQHVAADAFAFIAGPLREDPRRAGRQLQPPLHPLYSARREGYRIIYRIHGAEIIIDVVALADRRRNLANIR